MPLESKLKKMIDVLLPDSIKIFKGKVTLQDHSVFHKFNPILQRDAGKKVIGNIYEVNNAAFLILSYILGGRTGVMEGLNVYMPTSRERTEVTSYTNIKNIPNLKWNYEPEDQIQAPKL